MNFKAAFVFVLAILVFSCKNEESKSHVKTQEEIKRDLLSMERSNPTKYLSVSGNYRKFFNTFTVDITVNNSATLATFKDVVITVQYKTKTNTVLKTEDYVQYDFFPPGKSVSFTWKLKDAPKGSENISLSFKNAKAG